MIIYKLREAKLKFLLALTEVTEFEVSVLQSNILQRLLADFGQNRLSDSNVATTITCRFV